MLKRKKNKNSECRRHKDPTQQSLKLDYNAQCADNKNRARLKPNAQIIRGNRNRFTETDLPNLHYIIIRRFLKFITCFCYLFRLKVSLKRLLDNCHNDIFKVGFIINSYIWDYFN